MYKILITTTMRETGTGNTQVALHSVVVEFSSIAQAREAIEQIRHQRSSTHVNQSVTPLFDPNK